MRFRGVGVAVAHAHQIKRGGANFDHGVLFWRCWSRETRAAYGSRHTGLRATCGPGCHGVPYMPVISASRQVGWCLWLAIIGKNETHPCDIWPGTLRCRTAALLGFEGGARCLIHKRYAGAEEPSNMTSISVKESDRCGGMGGDERMPIVSFSSIKSVSFCGDPAT